MTDASGAERFRRQAVSPEEAWRRLLPRVSPLGSETAALAEAWGQRLARQVTAEHPLPPFRRSGMDGYAVRAADLPPEGAGKPAFLEVLESIPAGSVPQLPIGPGQASRIMTGAMLPEGADTVVMLEMTETETHDGRTYVRVGKNVPRGRNVSEAGSELPAGAALFAPGRRIGVGETAMLAALGIVRVPVTRRPRVGVLATGSELLAADEPLVSGKIRDSNVYMLSALLREAGAEPVLLGRVADDVDEAESRIRQALSGCDLLLTTGGVSVGDSDVIVDILARWEGRTLFNKVTMRPGSPTTAAVLDGNLWIALSGNPGACFVGFHLFAAPALRAMAGCASPLPFRFQARLAEPFSKVNAYTRYVRGRTELRGGEVWVRPTGKDESSLMTTIADANCLMVIAPLKEELEEGTLIDVLSLEGEECR